MSTTALDRSARDQAAGVPSPGLAARYYTDPRVAEIEKDHIFARTWQLACHESDLDEVGSPMIVEVAGREVMVVRTAVRRHDDPGLAAHLNVCRHRGAALITGPEPEGKAIRCPYHGWTYNLDGSLVGAPEGKSIPCLDRPSLGLFPARVESFLGFVFVNLDPGATPLRDRMTGITDLISRYIGPDLELLESDRRVWRYLAIYPNTLIDFYPDHVLTWKIVPHATGTAALLGAFYARKGTRMRTRLAQRLNIKIGWITNDEDATLVARVQRGISTPGWGPGPLSRREASVSWFANHIRHDVDPHLRLGAQEA